jgi:hypothetical protein
MSATEQDQAPVPLDPFGNEICLLFLKYGKCRYKKKCKKSHIIPDKSKRSWLRLSFEWCHAQSAMQANTNIAFSLL